jgi:hypothetical protein
MLLWLYMHVSSVSFVLDVCCKCFHLDVLKVDLGRAHFQLCGAATAWVIMPLWVIASLGVACMWACEQAAC